MAHLKVHIMQGSSFWVSDLSQRFVRSNQYWCTNTWYISMYQCFREEEEEGEKEGMIERGRKKEDGSKGSSGGGSKD